MNQGDERHRQFLALYSPLHERLVRFVQVLIWDKEEVRDIVSDTVLAAMEQFNKVQHPDAFLYYLFTIARRKVNMYITRKQRFVPLDVHNIDEPIDNSKGVLEQLNSKELHSAILQLPELYRESLVLFELSGFSIREISGLLTISENGIKSRLVRARIMLSKKLEGELHERNTKNAS